MRFLLWLGRVVQQQTKLAAEATKLSRTVFASLPWGFRLAHLFEKLAVDTQEAFGRFAYAEFLKAGVVGLPDIGGQPALSLRDKIQGPRAADKLPRGYGKAFGTKVWKVTLAKFRNPELVEEAISRVMLKMHSGDMKLREGSDLKTAENFVVTSVINATTDVIRRQKRETPSLVKDEDGEAAEVDISDPHAFQSLENMISPSEMSKIMQDLGKINVRAPAWVEAQLEGLTDRELAAEWGVTPSAIINFKNRYLDKIQAVFNKYLRAVA